MELFAGSRMATRCISAAGFKATCIDLDDAKEAGHSQGSGTAFDILSASGFARLGFHCRSAIC